MQLPKRGALVDEDGHITWMWSRNQIPEGETWEGYPLISVDPVSGETNTEIKPSAFVFDLTGITTPDEMSLLHNAHARLRIRKNAEDEWTITEFVPSLNEEVPHVLDTVLKRKRAEVQEAAK